MRKDILKKWLEKGKGIFKSKKQVLSEGVEISLNGVAENKISSPLDSIQGLDMMKFTSHGVVTSINRDAGIKAKNILNRIYEKGRTHGKSVIEIEKILLLDSQITREVAEIVFNRLSIFDKKAIAQRKDIILAKLNYIQNNDVLNDCA